MKEEELTEDAVAELAYIRGKLDGMSVEAAIKEAFISGLHYQRQRILEGVEGLERETCSCEDETGYHTKDCDMEPYGWNAALQAIQDLIQGKD